MPSRNGDTNRVAAVLVAGILALLWADPAFAFDVHRAQIVGGPPGLIESLIAAFLARKKHRATQFRLEPVLAMPRVEPALSTPAPAPAPEPAPLPESNVSEPVAAPKQRRPRITLDGWARDYIATQQGEITATLAYAVYSEECRLRRRKIAPRLEFGRAFENAALALGMQRVKRAGRLSYAA